MFFKRKKQKTGDSVDHIAISNQMPAQKMPIITLDNLWHQLMAKIKTPYIEQLEKQLTQLLKEQGKLNTDQLEYTRMKKNMLDTILQLTHDAFEMQSEEAIKKIKDQQKMILKINENIGSIEKQLEDIPDKIQEVNAKLLEQTVQVCYEHLNEFKKESEQLEEEIHIIREHLMRKTEHKKLADEKAAQLYQYLHQLVGSDFIEKLDRIYWEKK